MSFEVSVLREHPIRWRARAESREAPQALPERVWGLCGENPAEGLWRTLGQELSELKRKWRAEVGPRMRGVPPATGSFLPERIEFI